MDEQEKERYLRMYDLMNVTVAELRDKRARGNFRKLLKQGQAHELAALIERVCAIWGFIYEETLGKAPDSEDALADLEDLANFSGHLTLVALALHDEPDKFNIARDYPPLRTQLAGAMSAGVRRGARGDYEPQADLKLIAQSPAAVVMLFMLFEYVTPSAYQADPLNADFGVAVATLSYPMVVRTQLVKLMLAAQLGTLQIRELTLLETLWSQARSGHEEQLKEAVARSTEHTQQQLKLASERSFMQVGSAGKIPGSTFKLSSEQRSFIEEMVGEIRSLQSAGHDYSSLWDDQEDAEALADPQVLEQLLQQHPELREVINNFHGDSPEQLAQELEAALQRKIREKMLHLRGQSGPEDEAGGSRFDEEVEFVIAEDEDESY